MKKLFKLFRRILIHKFWVAYYCFQIGLYWQGITHDLSKFSLTEIKGSLKYWSDNESPCTYERRVNGFSAIFLHHKGRNPHHYEYWIYGDGIPVKMPLKYVQELICDYLAACKTYGGNPRNEYDWWIKHSKHMKICDETKFYIYRVFEKFKNSNMSLRKCIEYANSVDNISVGDSYYSEFINFINYMDGNN